MGVDSPRHAVVVVARDDRPSPLELVGSVGYYERKARELESLHETACGRVATPGDDRDLDSTAPGRRESQPVPIAQLPIRIEQSPVQVEGEKTHGWFRSCHGVGTVSNHGHPEGSET